MVKGAPFSTSDLIVNEGRIYHLDIRPEDMAPNILIVGDPGRTTSIADEFMTDLELNHEHRGLRTVTGRVKETRRRVTVTTSGMGTPSLEIVANELVALNEIDFGTRTRKDAPYRMLNIIRVGTSGGLQEETALGTPIISAYAIGMDNTGLFYENQYPRSQRERATCHRIKELVQRSLDSKIAPDATFAGEIRPYVTAANGDLVHAMAKAASRLQVEYEIGITVSSSGFFANQGRALARTSLTVPDIDSLFADLDTGFLRMRCENMEMETSFLLHFFGGLGYRAGSICPVLANRQRETTMADYSRSIRDATRIALHALAALGK